MYTAIYEYQLNGITKKKIIVSSMEPPTVITMYYTPGAKKAISDYDAGNGPLIQIFLLLIPLFIALLVIKLLGYNG